MPKERRKGVALLVWFVVVALGIALVATPLGRGFVSAMVNSPTLCTDDPYNWKCVCTFNQDKKPLGAGRYTCISALVESLYSFPLSKDDLEFSGKALKYAKDTISSSCPSCDTMQCSDASWLDTVSVAYDSQNQKYFGYVECKEQTNPLGGYYWWRVAFNLDDGSIFTGGIDSYCMSRDNTKCNIG